MLSQKNTRAASNFPWIPVAISEEYIFQFQIQYLVKQSISKIAPFLILKYFFHLQQDCGPGPGYLDTADTTFRFSCWWLTAGKSQFWWLLIFYLQFTSYLEICSPLERVAKLVLSVRSQAMQGQFGEDRWGLIEEVCLKLRGGGGLAPVCSGKFHVLDFSITVHSVYCFSKCICMLSSLNSSVSEWQCVGR